MSEFSKYPNQIDTTTEIPKATDNVTPVKAESVNRIRDGLIAAESELGIKPSGTYSTVRARLDDMDSRISSESGGGSGSVSVQKSGSSVVSVATKLNFTGNVSVAVGATNQTADIAIGGDIQQKQESFTPSNNQVSFTLSQTPLQSNAVEMFVNGLKQVYGSDYIVSSTSVSYSGVSLINSDTIEFWYLISNGIISGPSFNKVTAVTNTDSPYLVLNTDYHLSINSSVGVVTVTLPAAPATGQFLELKDANGTAGSNNITINGNGKNIDGASSYVMVSSYASLRIRYNGSRWSIV